MRSPLLPFAVSVWAGSLAAQSVADRSDPRMWYAATITTLVVGFLARHQNPLVPAGLVLGAVAAGLRVLPLVTGPVADVAADRAIATVTGRVVSDPQHVTTRNALDWSPRQSQVMRLRTASVTARGRSVAVAVPLLVYCDCSAPAPGSLVSLTGRLGPAPPSRGLAAVLTAVSIHTITPPPRYQTWALSLRSALHLALRDKPATAAQLVPGLALGDTSALSARLAADMRAAGLSHLTAVSGANVALVIAAALRLTRGRRREVRVAVALAALAAFTFLVRPQPSVVRAAAMGAVVALALLLRRRTAAVASLSVAVAGLLVWDPWLAGSYGFALSALATAGLIVSPVRPRRWWSVLLAATVAAQLAVLPVTVALGSPVSLAALPANLVSVPMAGVVMVVGMAACLAAAVWLPLGSAIAWLTVPVVQPIAWAAQLAAGADRAVLPWPAGPTGVAAASLLTAWLAWHAVRWPLLDIAQRAAAITATAVLVASCLQPPDPTAPVWPPPGWVMVQCDVGQGDATVLRVAAHQAVVIDTGPDPDTIDSCLRRLQVNTVPLLVLSHFHADHVGGIPGVLHRRRVGTVLATPLAEPDSMVRYVSAELAVRGLRPTVLTYRGVVQVGALVLHCVWPARLIRGQGSDPNNASIVLRIDIGGVRFLLPGDVEPAAQEELATMVGRVDVMKIAHHGSARQSTALAAVTRPALVTVSVGEDNDYGHPAASALALYRSMGARVVRTDQAGDIAIVLRGGEPVAVLRGHHT